MQERYDVLVVGGGINGAGIARDAVGRGLSVCLCEADDLAAHTSSASTKLIHGGLRYLEQYEFGLVGKALAEREVLLRLAPHIAWPLRFVLPHQPHLRPAWMIRAGLFLYDRLGGKRTLQGSRRVDLRSEPVGAPLRDEFSTGFAYSDGWVQDARLVVLNAMDAAQRGASIRTRTRCVQARRVDGHWQVTLEDAQGQRSSLQASALVNAAGPWAVQFLDQAATLRHRHALRLVKGSHIVVPRMFAHESAYIFQQPDRRIVFAIPYERDYTLVGTTDMEYHGDPRQPRIDAAEVRYLCEAVNRYFRKPVTADEVVWSYSGVRPLLEDEEDNASEVTRDYQLELDAHGAPLLSVFGGKLTTYRRLAEEAVDLLAKRLGHSGPAWTAQGAPLPGGDLAGGFDAQLVQLRQSHPWLPPAMAWRLLRNYGTRVTMILGAARALEGLGRHYGADLYQAEVDYLCTHEYVRQAEDLLWRRSKLGLRLDPAAQAALAASLSARAHPGATVASR